MTLWLVSQAATDPISGGAGWVGAGLLGLVLCWVFFVHLPALFKQLKEKDQLQDEQMREKDRLHAEQMKAKDDLLVTTVTGLTETHSTALKVVVAEFRAVNEALAERADATNARMVEHCDKEIERMITFWQSRGHQ